MSGEQWFELAQAYTHPHFPPGTNVRVLETIHAYVANHPCAGQEAQVTTGYYWSRVDYLEHVDRAAMVPVKYQRRLYDIPEQYVEQVEPLGRYRYAAAPE
jgi:hypothetical protein